MEVDDASARQLHCRLTLSGASAKPISGFGTLTTELYRCSIPLQEQIKPQILGLIRGNVVRGSMFARYLSAGLGARPLGLADLNGNFLPTWRGMATDRPPDPVQRPRPQGLKLGTLVLSQRDVMVVAVGLAATVWLYDLLFEEGWLKKSHKEHIEDQYQSSHEKSKAD